MAEARGEQQLRGVDRPRLPGARLFALALLVLLLLGFVGLGSGRPSWRVGGPSQLVSPRSYGGDIAVLGLAAAAAVFGLVVYAFWGVRPQRDDDELETVAEPFRAPWWTVLLVVLVTLASFSGVMLLLLSLFSHGRPVSRRGFLPPAAGGSARQTSPSAHHVGLPPVHWWGLAVLVLVPLAAAVATGLLRHRRLEPDLEPESADDGAELLAAVDLSLEEIEREPDPRRAVIRAYTRMEGALGRYGLARRPFETPLEYLARALSSLRIGHRSVERLTVLHERAKFSQHEVDASMKSEALTALTALRDELSGAR